MTFYKRLLTARDAAWEMMEEGKVTYQAMAEMCLSHMSADDIKDMLESNDLLDEVEEEEGEEE